MEKEITLDGLVGLYFSFHVHVCEGTMLWLAGLVGWAGLVLTYTVLAFRSCINRTGRRHAHLIYTILLISRILFILSSLWLLSHYLRSEPRAESGSGDHFSIIHCQNFTLAPQIYCYLERSICLYVDRSARTYTERKREASSASLASSPARSRQKLPKPLAV